MASAPSPAGSHGVVRPAAPGDTPAIQELISGVYAEYDCVLVLAEEPHLIDPGKYFRAHGGEFWVVEAAGRVRATAAVALRPEGAELKSLYVHVDLRKQGWGRRLVELATDHARQAGRRTLFLWSDTRFLDAHRLYRRLGFTEGGVRDLNDSNRSVERYFERAIHLPAP